MPKKTNITYTGQTTEEGTTELTCYKCKKPEDIESGEYNPSRLHLVREIQDGGKIMIKFFLCRRCMETLVNLEFSVAGHPPKREYPLGNGVTLDACAICNRDPRDETFIHAFDEHTQLDTHHSDAIILKHNIDINDSICQECAILIDIMKRTSFDNNNETYFPDTYDDSKTIELIVEASKGNKDQPGDET